MRIFEWGISKRRECEGLDRVRYFDKTDSNREKTQQGEIAIISETDRVYLNTIDAIELDDPVPEAPHPRDEREFTHDRCLESVGREGAFLVGFWR